MPKLRVFSGAQLIALFEKHGYQRVRQRGSHVILRRDSVSFPVPLHREIDRGTLSAIIRQSGLPRALFEQ
ncbi:MAG: type II toxin-antitoxin system HicA family toxin [Chthoniobacterales bacterium]